jgi:hypothetical protein
MSWGAIDPKYMVLGFSKGANQAEIALSAPHDSVAYRGFRPTLTAALRVLGLLGPNETVDEHISKEEPDWAFGSVVRCTIEKLNRETGKFEKSGDVIAQSARRGARSDWIGQCLTQHLGVLPTRLETVVMLSNDDAYVEACFAAVRRLHTRVRRINEVAYGDGRATWVHIVHPAGTSGRHIPAWLNGEFGKQGRKMRAATAALALR